VQLSQQAMREVYEKNKNREIAFNKTMMEMTGLEPKKVFLKIKGEHTPCVIYACSLSSAKIIVHLEKSDFDKINDAKGVVNLRFSFLPRDSKSSIVFFVPSMVTGYNTFSKRDANTFLVSLDYTNRPPDDLINILGGAITIAENFEKRKDVRINVEDRIFKDIGFASVQAVALVDNIRRPCIVKNVSASGALIILSCFPKLLMGREVVLQLRTIENESVNLHGNFVRSDEVVKRQDIHGMGVTFKESGIPLEYKVMINRYLDKLEDMLHKNEQQQTAVDGESADTVKI
jgi:hypothetical protein